MAAVALGACAAAGAATAATVGLSRSGAAPVDCSTRAAIFHVTLTVAGDVATATFEVAPGCADIRISIASYRAAGPRAAFPQTYHDGSTGVFSAGGPYTLTTHVPPCFFQVDLVRGDVIAQLKSTGNIGADVAHGTLYGSRKIRVVAGGSVLCNHLPPPHQPPPHEPPPTTTTDTTHTTTTSDTTHTTTTSDTTHTTTTSDTTHTTTTGTTTHGTTTGTTTHGTTTGTTTHGTTTGTTTTTTTGTTTASGGTTATSPTTTGTVAGAVVTVDVAVTKAAKAPTVAVGSNATFQVTVKNNGPGTATGVSLVDTLPAGLSLVSATPSQGSCTATAPLTCSLGTLASGASATISIVARATQTGTLVNHASVTANEPETNLTNNTAQASVTARGPFTPPKTGVKGKQAALPAKHAVVRGGTKPAFTG